MNSTMAFSLLDDHSRTIVHIDIDCFYAQVEMNRNPGLRNLPLGIQQKNIVVTSNYIAREYGITKCMLIEDARKLCPNLQLVRGENLYNYRKVSSRLTDLLKKYSKTVERLGLDENFVDISKLVGLRLEQSAGISVEGNTFGDTVDLCDCGCYERLAVGAKIAMEIREEIKSKLKLTTCAGIAHNKLLAKIVCTKHKPNEQTVVFPNSAVELMLSLGVVSKIPGIGVSLTGKLKAIGIETVEDLQNSSISKLTSSLGAEKAKIVYHQSFGIDKSEVKPSKRPESIGIEESCKIISTEKAVREKFLDLLKRLLILVSEDGRKPQTLKMTVRKYDKNNKYGIKATRQCKIDTILFEAADLSKLCDHNLNNIMAVVMRLFYNLISKKQPYHLTLLGLSFTKFTETPSSDDNGILMTYFKKGIEIDSGMKYENQVVTTDSEMSPSTSYSDNNETESAPKRFKICDTYEIKNDVLKNFDDCGSLKLKVTDIKGIQCPPNVSEEVFQELPRDLQEEIWEEYKRNIQKENSVKSQPKQLATNTLLNYFVKR